jgi:hypothetical protein
VRRRPQAGDVKQRHRVPAQVTPRGLLEVGDEDVVERDSSQARADEDGAGNLALRIPGSLEVGPSSERLTGDADPVRPTHHLFVV